MADDISPGTNCAVNGPVRVKKNTTFPNEELKIRVTNDFDWAGIWVLSVIVMVANRSTALPSSAQAAVKFLWLAVATSSAHMLRVFSSSLLSINRLKFTGISLGCAYQQLNYIQNFN